MRYYMPPVEGFTLHWIDDKPIYVGIDIDIAYYESYCKKAVERNTHISVHHHLLHEVVHVEYRKYARRAYVTTNNDDIERTWEYSYIPFLTVSPIIVEDETQP